MSKSLKIDMSFLEQAKADFLKMFDEGKFNDGNINFSRKFVGETNKKANLFIDDIAWNKMKALVDEFKTEIAWHGIARRGEKEAEYYIDDIIVYPQKVSGATVVTDQEKYQMWLYEQDDEVFNNIRMQGHSHVNMGTSPSGVDTTYYESIVEQLDDDMFYIFMILNKSGSRFVKIYDKAINTMFETSDITVTLLMDPEDPINVLIKDAKEKVKEEVKVVPRPTYSSTYTGGNYNYGKSSYGVSKPIAKPSHYSMPGLSSNAYNDIMNDPYGTYEY